jgi:molecular chaperone GrpE
MPDVPIPKPTQPPSGQERPEIDNTVDLDLDEAVDDLQAFADQVAECALGPVEPAGEGVDPTSLESEEADLFMARNRIAELEKLEADYHDKHQRLLADFANHRNRVARETQLAITLAEKKMLLELLPVVDNLERCMSSNYTTVEDFHNGISLIYKQFVESLRKLGVEEVPVGVGDSFDAMNAEALTTTSQPTLPDGAVAAVYERGYMLRDMLLRPARVIVNHHPHEGNPDAEGSRE